MNTRHLLLALQTFIGLTAVAGGVALITGLIPKEVVAGSPFDNALIPGLILAGVVGGLNVLAAFYTKARDDRAEWAGLVAATALIIWITVEAVIVPEHSVLQAVYFVLGLSLVPLVLFVEERR